MVLLHRDDATARLDKALRACADGTAQLVLTEGAPGCGKTRFLWYAADTAAAQGFTVLHLAADPAGRRRDRALLRRLTAVLTTLYPPGEDAAPGGGFGDLLTAACARGPVALCVDDVQYADRGSLDELLRLAHALRGAPLITVLTRSPHHRSDGAGLHTELLRHPGFVRIPLARLDVRDTAELARFWGMAVPADAALRLHRLSGGNPLLVRALLAETAGATGSPADTSGSDGAGPDPEPGGPFSEAFVTCVRRCGPAARRLALALAVLGPQADLPRAARLARLGADAAVRARNVLRAAGLVTDTGRLPHPVAESAVLATLPAEQRRAMHRDAARVLHHALAEPVLVARQLLAAGAAAHDWEIQALRDAAPYEPGPATGLDGAQAFLRLARAGCRDEPTRHRVTLQLASYTWRLHPAAAHRLLDEPYAALRAGQLSPADAGWLARLLAAQGRVAEADEALAHADPDVRPAPDGLPLRLLGTGSPGTHDRPGGQPARAAARWLVPGSRDDVGAAERQLDETPLTPATYESVSRALRTLVHHRPYRAAAWCARLAAQPLTREAPGWQAAFATAHADALLRLGDLDGARRAAASAIDLLGGRGGPFLLAPLALLVQALTEQGEYAAAAVHLHPTLPGEPYSTVHALAFLRARGRHALATGRPQAALDEFLEAGRIAGRWGADQPDLLPWRTDAAEALLALGRPAEAQALIADQLALPVGTGARVRGVTLRLSAATAEPRRRVALLADAVEELRDYGDRLELARCLADLGGALRLSGEGNRAGTVIRRAWQLAADCGAVPLRERIRPTTGAERAPELPELPERPGQPEQSERLGGAEAVAEAVRRGGDDVRLSGAEERVAALAAHGHTNREIAARLFVSASTVERHLTCVYRKLGIARRQDLPLELRMGAFEPAEG
ncbi:LuxR C-terminal-related transcriptional regulator [Streptomyces sp. NPDC047000]|uniref:helix-turn-helix transcriptional regulator n=1 Tax=Streptomyces sp. NPDC047000 TaxID=3155474 RepID=UPI0033E9441A